MRRPVLASLAVTLWLVPALAGAQAPDEPRYVLPPKAIVDALDAPPPPDVYLSPARDVVAVLDRAPMPSIAELARPMLRLAGLRIDPKNNGRHRARTARALTLKAVADGAARAVTLPASPALFSSSGRNSIPGMSRSGWRRRSTCSNCWAMR